MRPFNLIFILGLLHFISSKVEGLKCYTCNHDNNNPNPKCITHPETLTSSDCKNPKHDYCYTRKIVKINGDEVYFTRNCCRVGEANVCPRGSAVNHENDGEYITYWSRCKGDLCNKGDGTTADIGEDSDIGGAVILVPGASGNGLQNNPRMSNVILGLFGSGFLYRLLR